MYWFQSTTQFRVGRLQSFVNDRADFCILQLTHVFFVIALPEYCITKFHTFAAIPARGKQIIKNTLILYGSDGAGHRIYNFT